MSTEIFETVSELFETSTENCHKACASGIEVSKKLLQQQKEITESLIEAAKAKADKVAGSKDYQSFAAHSAELAQECGQILAEAGKGYAEILTEAGKTFQQLFEAGVKTATANSNIGGKAKGKKSA